MWEIVTRQLPFSGPGYVFDAKVEDAVLSGTRPTIPDDTTDDLGSLIGECWQAKPNSRPPFTDIVPRLHTMAYGLLQTTVNNADIFRSEASSTETTNLLHEMLNYDAEGTGTGTVQACVEIHQSSTIDETSV